MALILSGSDGISTTEGTPAIGNDAIGTNQLANSAVTIAKLAATGTPSSSTFLRGDNTWAAIAGFPSGTVMLFAQTSAPTGWTKDTTNFNNSGLRVVTGTASTGGSVDFTTAFASQTPSGSVSINTSGLSAGATTLSTSQIPSHTHSVIMGGDNGTQTYPREDGSNQRTSVTGATGGGGSHSHSMSGSATGSFTGNAINLAVKYVDVIRATKD
jgi:hypothetical protein